MLAGGIRILQGLQEGWREGGDEGYRMEIEESGQREEEVLLGK